MTSGSRLSSFTRPLPQCKLVSLVAHDSRKQSLLRWASDNLNTLSCHSLCATGTTGTLLEEALGRSVHKFHSGPLGGDQEIGAKIANGEIHALIFFWDPLAVQPHDADIKALMRIAQVYNIPVAYNTATADFLISSSFFNDSYYNFNTSTESMEPVLGKYLYSPKRVKIQSPSKSDSVIEFVFEF